MRGVQSRHRLQIGLHGGAGCHDAGQAGLRRISSHGAQGRRTNPRAITPARVWRMVCGRTVRRVIRHTRVIRVKRTMPARSAQPKKDRH